MADLSNTTKTQVVIIGAGPTGLSMAAQLTRYNIDFVILEKNEHTTSYSKAVVVQSRSLEIFDELGLAKTAVQKGRAATAFNIFHKGKKRLAIELAGLGDGLTPFPYVLSLEQSKTEALLAEHLAAQGKSIGWKSTFDRMEEHSNGVTVYYTNAEGQSCTIAAAYCVGCDGAHSGVRHNMGAAFEGDTVPKLFYVADVTLGSPVINTDKLFGFLFKKGFVLFFPMEGDGHYRVIGILPDHSDDKITFKDIEPLIKTNIVSPVEFKELRWFSTYKVHSRMANTFMRGRCFIAGDAAHIHTPAGGQGMNTGIQDAYNLAWKLAYALNGTLNASVLDTYATERMANARHLLRTTDRMFDIMAGTNVVWDFIRLKIVPLVAGFVVKTPALNKGIFPLLSQIGISYPGSRLTAKSSVGKIKAGDRMPYFLLPSGAGNFDQLKEPAFKALFFGESSVADFSSLKNVKISFNTLTYNDIPKQIFGAATGFYILLRPDNYILYIGNTISEGLGVLRGFE